MSIGTIKHCSDVSHAVHTDSRAFEDGAEREQDDPFILPLNTYLHQRDVWKICLTFLLAGVAEICLYVEGAYRQIILTNTR